MEDNKKHDEQEPLKEENVEQETQTEQRNSDSEQNTSIDEKTKRKLICAIGYIPCGLLFFIPLIMYQNDQFAKFHANQSLVLFLTSVIGEVVFNVLGVISFLSLAMHILASVFGVLMLVLCILGIVNVVNEEQKKLPVIGEFSLIK